MKKRKSVSLTLGRGEKSKKGGLTACDRDWETVNESPALIRLFINSICLSL